MIVIKIGGSLWSGPYLTEWINLIAQLNSQPIIIVPGGGPFAEAVRTVDKQFELTPECSHDMAVMAMQQYARMICDLNPALHLLHSTQELEEINSASVWAPYPLVQAHCHYPKNWQTTSDSLSVWLAAYLESNHLCLVKSAQVAADQDVILKSDLVDDYFSHALADYQGKCHFYHASEAKKFMQQIENGYFG